MTGDAAYDLFISYAEADRAWVEGYLLDALHAAGVRVHSEEAFRLGAPRLLEFERAVKDSQRVLLILSPAYLAEGFAQFTDLLAQSYGLETATWPVIPLVLQRVELPTRLAMLESLDATDPEERDRALERLCTDLQRPVPAPAPPPECPYPGMVPFRVEDARFFFGREGEIKELRQRLRNQSLILVVGPSGSGKSSLVFGGLLPELAERQAGKWIVRDLRPGAQPVEALAQVLGIAVWPDEEGMGVAVEAALEGVPQGQRLLLIVDQLEELFTQAAKAQQPGFFGALKALSQEGRCAVLLTMRADFYGDLMTSDLWPVDRGQWLEVAPLRGAALREAIVKPAEAVGVYLEEGLVERLLADAAEEPGVLPLVQETMVLLWEEMERRLIPLRAYEELGDEGQSGLAVAMRLKADAAWTALSAEGQGMARRILLRLVQFGEGRADTRRQQPVAELRSSRDDAALFDQTLEHLSDNRLLTLGGGEGEGGGRADLAHEGLIEGWPRLGEWIAERREAELIRRRLEGKAAEWEQFERRGGLLDEIELGEAERWLSSPDAGELGGASDALGALVEASRAAIEERKRREEEARQRELELERARAEAERQRAEEQARHAVELQEQIRRTERQLRLARSSQLAAQAHLVLDRGEDPSGSLPLLLAREAVLTTLLAHEAVTIEADAALRRVVDEAPPWRTSLPRHRHTNAVASALFSPDGQVILTASFDRLARLWDAVTGEHLRCFEGHAAPVVAVAFSPDGRTFVSAGYDRTARLWDVSTGQEIRSFEGHSEWLSAVAFSPDGRMVATASGDRTARLWDAATGKEIVRLAGHSAWLNAVAFSPDGRMVVMAGGDREGNDCTVRLWDASSGAEIRRFEGHTARVISIAFSQDGRHIATSSVDHTACLWDAATGAQVRRFEGHGSPVNSVAFSPGGETLVTGGRDRTIRLWDVATGVEVRRFEGHRDWINSAAFSPDGQTVLTAGDDRTARLWDAATGREIPRLPDQTSWVHSVAFDPEGQTILTASADGIARLWSLVTGKEVRRFVGHSARLLGAGFSPDGQAVVTASEDGTARLWKTATGSEIRRLEGHTGSVNSAAFSPDGQTVLTAGDDRTACLWDAATGTQVRCFRGHSAPLSSAAFGPDGQIIVTTSGGSRVADHFVRLWDVASGKEIRRLDGHTDWVHSAAFSPDGQTLVTASQDKTARLWDVASGAEVRRLEGHSAPVNWAAFSPDGRSVITASGSRGLADNTIRLWDAATGAETLRLAGHTGKILAAAFSPDGQSIASASGSNSTSFEVKSQLYAAAADDTIRLWDRVPLAHRYHLDCLPAASVLGTSRSEGGMAWVNSTAFGPDGRTVLTVISFADPSAASAILLWDVAAGRVTHRLTGHTGIVSARLSRDGRLLVSAGNDGTVRLWDAGTGAEIRRFSGHTAAVNWADFSPDGRTVVTGAGFSSGDSPVQDATARLWDVVTGTELRRLEGHTGPLWAAAFSPDGRTVVTASEDKSVRIWDVVSGQEIRCLTGHERAVWSAEFSPDGLLIVTAGADGTARLWDAATGAAIRRFEGHTHWVKSAAFSPDGRTIVTASLDQTARLWDVATGVETRRLTGHTDRLMSAAFSPDGQTIITGSVDGTARLWPSIEALMEMASSLIQREPASFSAEERRRFGLL